MFLEVNTSGGATSANPNTHKKKSVLAKPHLSLAFPDLSPSDIEDYKLAQTFKAVAIERRQPRTSFLRHVHSASNLQWRERTENPEISCPVGSEGSVGLPSTGSWTSEGCLSTG